MSPVHSVPPPLPQRPLPFTALLDKIWTECCQSFLQRQLGEGVLEGGHTVVARSQWSHHKPAHWQHTKQLRMKNGKCHKI